MTVPHQNFKKFMKSESRIERSLRQVKQSLSGKRELYNAINTLHSNKVDRHKDRKLFRKLLETDFTLHQPDISNPKKFFDRINLIKKGIEVTGTDMTLTDFF